jgi:hypothetical protein
VNSKKTALPLAILNCVCPGLGTFISAFLDQSSAGVNVLSIGYSLLQASLTIVFLLGWYWSIYHGFLMY